MTWRRWRRGGWRTSSRFTSRHGQNRAGTTLANAEGELALARRFFRYLPGDPRLADDTVTAGEPRRLDHPAGITEADCIAFVEYRRRGPEDPGGEPAGRAPLGQGPRNRRRGRPSGPPTTGAARLPVAVAVQARTGRRLAAHSAPRCATPRPKAGLSLGRNLRVSGEWTQVSLQKAVNDARDELLAAVAREIRRYSIVRGEVADFVIDVAVRAMGFAINDAISEVLAATGPAGVYGMTPDEAAVWATRKLMAHLAPQICGQLQVWGPEVELVGRPGQEPLTPSQPDSLYTNPCLVVRLTSS